MCGRFSLYFYPDAEWEFEQLFGLVFPRGEFPDAYNIAPQAIIPAVRSDSQGRRVSGMTWGLISPFSKEFKPHRKYKMSNTRAESFDKPGTEFRKELLSTSRCIIPANNYFEWMKLGNEKVPFKIESKESLFLAFGGIYSVWRGHDDERFLSCSIITSPANDFLAKLHPRMPFILQGNAVDLWLDRDITDFQVLRDAIVPAANESLQYFPVSKRVNSTQNDDPDLVTPLPGLEAGTQSDLFL